MTHFIVNLIILTKATTYLQNVRQICFHFKQLSKLLEFQASTLTDMYENREQVIVFQKINIHSTPSPLVLLTDFKQTVLAIL